MGTGEFRCYPHERSGDARHQNAPERDPIHCPGKTAGKNPPRHRNQQQNAPTAEPRHSSMHGQNFCNPGDGRKYKRNCVNKTTEKRHQRLRAKEHHQQQTDADPRVHREVEPGE